MLSEIFYSNSLKLKNIFDFKKIQRQKIINKKDVKCQDNQN